MVSGKFERGYFGPSPSMLALTDKFVAAVLARLRKIGYYNFSVTKLSDSETKITVHGESSYVVYNDGIQASWQRVA